MIKFIYIYKVKYTFELGGIKMNENIFTTNVEPKSQKTFSRSFKFLLGLGIFLTGILSMIGILFMVSGFTEQIWKKVGMYEYIKAGVGYGCVVCFLICMVLIIKNKKMISRLLIRCIQSMGVLITISAFVLPRLSGYKSSGFEIMYFDSFTLIDGYVLVKGILFLIFARLIKEGFAMQNELDEIL